MKEHVFHISSYRPPQIQYHLTNWLINLRLRAFIFNANWIILHYSASSTIKTKKNVKSCMMHAKTFLRTNLSNLQSRARIVITIDVVRWPIRPDLFSSVSNASLLLQIYNMVWSYYDDITRWLHNGSQTDIPLSIYMKQFILSNLRF